MNENHVGYKEYHSLLEKNIYWVGSKLNIKSSVAFLYTSNELGDSVIRQIILFTNSFRKKIRYLGITLRK